MAIYFHRISDLAGGGLAKDRGGGGRAGHRRGGGPAAEGDQPRDQREPGERPPAQRWEGHGEKDGAQQGAQEPQRLVAGPDGLFGGSPLQAA